MDIRTVYSQFCVGISYHVLIFLEYSIAMFHWGTFPTMKVKFVSDSDKTVNFQFGGSCFFAKVCLLQRKYLCQKIAFIAEWKFLSVTCFCLIEGFLPDEFFLEE